MMYDSYDYLSPDETLKLNHRHCDGKRLRGNSWVYDDGETLSLVSYDTTIMTLHRTSPVMVLSIDCRACEYSNTTCRHISEFCRVYLRALGIDYYTIKGFIIDAIPGQSVELYNGQLTLVAC